MSRNAVIALSLGALLSGAAAIVGLAPASFAANEAEPAVVQTPPSIRVTQAERRELVATLTVTGTILPRDEAAAGTDLNGLTVTALNADEGDMVKKGDVLAVLDRSTLDTQLAQMQASRAQAEANIAQMNAQIGDAEVGVRQAKDALDRAKALQAKGVATQAQLDNARHAFDSANAKLVSAQKALASSQAQLAVIDAQKDNVLLQIEKTEVRAPADGLVLARDATLGGIVSASSGPLFRIAIGAEFELAATVAETALPKLATGMRAEISLAGADKTIGGKIRRISPEINSKSRLGSIRITLDPGSAAHAGSFARGEVETLRSNAVAVPASAVIFRGDKAFLQAVSEGKVATVPVALGARAGGFVEVVSGIEEGQEIVSRAGTFVADGDLVTPIRGEKTGAIQP
ncbi:efflux RND transporter periplasmic adaptor subunit [Mesorhizobium sp. AaZ16]|uniref:efflux RND transporter periplasmic adaptor subunit n=1 Tax=Mesorhizobium sp. AaZ16 TaxID=3402289 RepID=UPI00374FD37E